MFLGLRLLIPLILKTPDLLLIPMIKFRRGGTTTPLILSQKPRCWPEGKEKPWLAQGQDLEEEGPHEEVALFTSLYAGDEEAGSKTEKDPPEALPEAPGAILPALPPGASLYSLCQR